MNLLDHLTQTAWALHEPVLVQLSQVVIRHAHGEKLTASEIDAAIEAARAGRVSGSAGYHTKGGVAVIPIRGVISKHSSQVNQISQPQGTSTKAVESDIRKALKDPDVTSILLDIESPGGSVEGLSSLADVVYAARSEKPVNAYVNDLAASAAYWIASQAEHIYATETAIVGSIGVYTVQIDASEQAAKEGIRVDVVRSGPFKGAGTLGEAITEEQRAETQRVVDDIHGLFVAAVARGRGIAKGTISDLADGRVFVGQDALERGLIDGIQSFSEALTATHGGRRVTLAASEVSDMDTKDQAAPSPEDVRAEDRQRLTDLKSAFPGDLPFALEQWESGHSVTEARAAYCAVVEQKLEASEKALATAEKKAEAKPEPKPVGVEPISADTPPTPSGFLARVKELKAEGLTPDQAISTAAREDPERHMAFVKTYNESGLAARELEFLAAFNGTRGN